MYDVFLFWGLGAMLWWAMAVRRRCTSQWLHSAAHLKQLWESWKVLAISWDLIIYKGSNMFRTFQTKMIGTSHHTHICYAFTILYYIFFLFSISYHIILVYAHKCWSLKWNSGIEPKARCYTRPPNRLLWDMSRSIYLYILLYIYIYLYYFLLIYLFIFIIIYLFFFYIYIYFYFIFCIYLCFFLFLQCC